MRCGLIFALGLIVAGVSFAQAPAITRQGVVNSAAWSSPVAPGSLISIFGTNLATGVASSGAPYPKTLGGTSVTIGGVVAPVSYVSPAQINAQVPASLPATLLVGGGAIGTSSVVVTTAAGSSPPETIGLTAASPGFFTADGSGCGEAAALNLATFTAASVNSQSISAAPGDFISLFGTGFGVAPGQPPDGTAPSGAASFATLPVLSIDNTIVTPSYAGLAPQLVGVDQINFQIPETTRDGCAVPVLASYGLGSQTVSLSVHRGRGQCVDPPAQSWGSIQLSKTVFSETGASFPTTEALFAIFPSGPAVQPPAAQPVVLAPKFATTGTGGVSLISSPVPIVFPACAVPGFTNLSASTLTLQSPSGATLNAPPQLSPAGASYYLTFPTGFLVPGSYTVRSSPSGAISLNAIFTVGREIQVEAPAAVSASQPLTVNWNGGDAESLVRVSLTTTTATAANQTFYSYAPAAGGSMSFGPVPAMLPGATAQITVAVLPATVPTVHVPGVTTDVQLQWQYTYSFQNLTVTP